MTVYEKRKIIIIEIGYIILELFKMKRINTFFKENRRLLLKLYGNTFQNSPVTARSVEASRNVSINNQSKSRPDERNNKIIQHLSKDYGG